MNKLKWKEVLAAIEALEAGSIPDGSVTNVKLANMASGTVKGRSSAGTGQPQDVAMGLVVSSGIHNASAKTNPVGDDELGISDSASSFSLKKTKVSELEYFESIAISGHAGYSSGNSQRPKFSVIQQDTTDSLIEYVPDATNGDYFNILEDCEFQMSACVASSVTGVGLYIVLNGASGNSVTGDGEVFGYDSGLTAAASGSRKLFAGDVVWIWHSNANGIVANSTFISIVARRAYG